jgi:amino acid transporter
MRAEIDAKVASFFAPLWRLLHDGRDETMCQWLFVICIAVSGILGCFWGNQVSYSFFFAAPAIAVAAFLMFYCGVCLGIVRLVERRISIEFQRPSIGVGIVCSAVLPFVLMIIVILLVIAGLMHSPPMHDSM